MIEVFDGVETMRGQQNYLMANLEGYTTTASVDQARMIREL